MLDLAASRKVFKKMNSDFSKYHRSRPMPRWIVEYPALRYSDRSFFRNFRIRIFMSLL